VAALSQAISTYVNHLFHLLRRILTHCSFFHQIKNLDYTKVVTVTYSNAANTWVSGQAISAAYSYSISGSSYEIWTFTGTIGSGGIKQFYIRYDVSGSSYYDNNGTSVSFP
jgi:hypothetical protein